MNGTSQPRNVLETQNLLGFRYSPLFLKHGSPLKFCSGLSLYLGVSGVTFSFSGRIATFGLLLWVLALAALPPRS